jgi:hypothetical protein
MQNLDFIARTDVKRFANALQLQHRRDMLEIGGQLRHE